MSDLNFDYSLLIPEFILAATAGVVLLADAFRRDLRISRGVLPGITAVGALAAGLTSLLFVNETDNFASLVAIDNFTTFFRVLFAATLVVVVLGSYEFVSREIRHQGEFYSMLVLMTLGASFLASAQELLTAYIGIELLSFSAYVAVSLQKHDRRSGEAGLKYVLLGGVASAILLYGLSLIYGSAGSTSYAEIGARLAEGTDGVELPLLLGLVMLVAGLGFKASAVPFHMWTPDAYEGAPLPVTAMLSTVSKAAVFGLFLRFFSGPLLPVIDDWQWMVAVIALLTMVVGNLVAIQQHNIKRLLAYSSIGQVGFMLMAITTVSDASASALLLHMGGYLITNLAVFMGVIAFYNHSRTEEISGFRGLAETNPYLALVIMAGLFSLSGMPLLAGFTTKFILFQAAADAGYLWLVSVAVIMSTISLYYYLMVVRQMYVLEPAGQPDADSATVHGDRPELRWRVSPASYLTTGVLLLAIVFVGVYATPLLTAADRAVAVLFPV
ncbi:MAG: NADH-quinone oxidoreductase subunit N [Dehalococcoidia bacterium]